MLKPLYNHSTIVKHNQTMTKPYNTYNKHWLFINYCYSHHNITKEPSLGVPKSLQQIYMLHNHCTTKHIMFKQHPKVKTSTLHNIRLFTPQM